MPDLNHPMAPHRFAATRQEDLILGCCKHMTLEDSFERQFTLDIIRPAFAALRWLNSERFGNSATIKNSIEHLEAEVEKLSKLPLRFSSTTKETNRRCPHCGSVGRSRPPEVPYCDKCLGLVRCGLDKVSSLEEGFGTDAI